MKGKYICPCLEFIWFVTIPCMVAYIVSLPNDHALNITFLFKVKTLNVIIMELANNRYKPILVNEILRFNSNGPSILIKFLISNWSKGLFI